MRRCHFFCQTGPDKLVSDRDQMSTEQPPASTGVPGRTVKKLSVLLPADLHQRARRHALLHDKTLTTLIIELLSTALNDAEAHPSDN